MGGKKESELVKRLKDGEHRAFNKVYEVYHRQLYLIARKYLKSHTLAEDAVQDIFIKLWVKRDKLREDGSLKGFLFTCMKNHVLNMIRDHKKRILTDGEFKESILPGKNVTDEDVIYSEYRHIVKRGLKQMPGRKREVFELKTYKGLNNEQIAKKLLISSNTVKVHYYIGSKFLRGYLKKHANI